MMFTQKIRILPDSFMRSGVVISKVFDILHMKFVNSEESFALSFPEYKFEEHGSLGNVIVVGCESKNGLEKLNLKDVFSSFSLYVVVSSKIEETDEFIFFKRKHTHNLSDNYKRRAEKNGKDFNVRRNTAIIRAKRREEMKHAYIDVRSKSTNRRYSLFVVPAETSNGTLNKYGLLVSN